MLDALRRRLSKDENGFTLIELMVVVLIIAILIAIAIPTFLGAQDRARDRGAQSDLRNAITAAKTIATDDSGQLTNVTVTSLTAAEGAIEFDTAGDQDTVGVVKSATAADAILVYKQSASGKWFGMATARTGDVGYCTGAAIGDVDGPVAVDATSGEVTGCSLDKW